MEIKGGKAPYQIQWSDGSSQQNLANIKAGNYVVNVTDRNGKSATQTINITEPYPLAIHSQTTPENCLSGNGSATIRVTEVPNLSLICGQIIHMHKILNRLLQEVTK